MIETPDRLEMKERNPLADMSLREFYTGIALWSLTASMGSSDTRGSKSNTWKPEYVADKAVQLADEVMLRLGKRDW